GGWQGCIEAGETAVDRGVYVEIRGNIESSDDFAAGRAQLGVGQCGTPVGVVLVLTDYHPFEVPREPEGLPPVRPRTHRTEQGPTQGHRPQVLFRSTEGSPVTTSCSMFSKSRSICSVTRPRGLNTKIQRSEEHTSELQSRFDLACRLLLEK